MSWNEAAELSAPGHPRTRWADLEFVSSRSVGRVGQDEANSHCKTPLPLDRAERDAANLASFSIVGPLVIEDCGNCRSDVGLTVPHRCAQTHGREKVKRAGLQTVNGL